MHKQLFFPLSKEQMKKFVALLTKKKGKTARNEWENDDSDILQALYSGHILFSYSLVNLFKQRYTGSVKSYKYLNKFIRHHCTPNGIYACILPHKCWKSPEKA